MMENIDLLMDYDSKEQNCAFCVLLLGQNIYLFIYLVSSKSNF